MNAVLSLNEQALSLLFAHQNNGDHQGGGIHIKQDPMKQKRCQDRMALSAAPAFSNTKAYLCFRR
jgi:hypothetical protein